MRQLILIMNLLSVAPIIGMNEKSIIVQNKTNSVVWAGYQEGNGKIKEKIFPHTSIELLSTTPFFVLQRDKEKDKSYMFVIKRYTTWFIIEPRKNQMEDSLTILHYDDRYIAKEGQSLPDAFLRWRF